MYTNAAANSVMLYGMLCYVMLCCGYTCALIFNVMLCYVMLCCGYTCALIFKIKHKLYVPSGSAPPHQRKIQDAHLM